MPHSIYIHLPFCPSRCAYCDFFSTTQAPPFTRYREALLAEHAWRAAALDDDEPLSLYLGGGTPSLWPADELAPLVALAHRAGEVTVEANPADLDRAWLDPLVDQGVTRLSLGVQALDDRRLHLLGRRHDAHTARQALTAARQSPIRSLSADLIFGTPDQDEAGLIGELDELVALGVDHLSVYELTWAAGTPLTGRLARNEIQRPDDDRLADLWLAAGEALARHGLERYEVSNHARPGHRSRHNVHYWRGGLYLGLGAGAHGHLPHGALRCRYANAADVEGYLAAAARLDPACPPDFGLGPSGTRELLGPLDQARELILLGLRSRDGIDLHRLRLLVEQAGGAATWNAYEAVVAHLLAEEHADRIGAALVPRPGSLLLADGLSALFP